MRVLTIFSAVEEEFTLFSTPLPSDQLPLQHILDQMLTGTSKVSWQLVLTDAQQTRAARRAVG